MQRTCYLLLQQRVPLCQCPDLGLHRCCELQLVCWACSCIAAEPTSMSMDPLVLLAPEQTWGPHRAAAHLVPGWGAMQRTGQGTQP